MMHFKLNLSNCAHNFVADVKKEHAQEVFVYELAGAEPHHCFVYLYVLSALCSCVCVFESGAVFHSQRHHSYPSGLIWGHGEVCAQKRG